MILLHQDHAYGLFFLGLIFVIVSVVVLGYYLILYGTRENEKAEKEKYYKEVGYTPVSAYKTPSDIHTRLAYKLFGWLGRYSK